MRMVLSIACLLCVFAGVAAPQQRLTVLTYNIQIGTGTDGKIDLERTAAVIRSANADVVALQEVDRKCRRTQGVDQAAELARLTGMRMVFGKASVREGIDEEGGTYGVAILTKLPIKRHENRALPYTRGFELRTVLEAELEWVTPLRLFATHFDNASAADRLASAKMLVKLAQSRPDVPAVVGGDLNDLPGSAPLQALAEAWRSAGGAPTFRADKPLRQLDYILFQPAERWRVIECRVLEEPLASDHRPVVAVLELL